MWWILHDLCKNFHPDHFQHPSLTFFMVISSHELSMQQSNRKDPIGRCMQVTEMKNDVQNIRRKATRPFNCHAGIADIGRRFAEQGIHPVAGEGLACTG